MKFIFFTLSFTLGFYLVNAQKIKYPVSDIPDNLKKNADAVIREHIVNQEIINDSRVETHEKYVVTIFNKSAQNLGYFVEFFDKTSFVSDYSVKIYNDKGYLLNKSKMNDFMDIKAYDGFSLFDDNRVIYYKAFKETYPYTIELEFKRTDKQTLFLNHWIPVPQYNVSVQYALLTFKSSPTFEINIKKLNFTPNEITKTVKLQKLIQWELSDFEAIKQEPFLPYATEILPQIKIVANTFNYDGYTGSFSSWKLFGNWEWNLITGRDVLPEKTILVLQNKTKDLPNDIEKIKWLYKYLQNNTRYVSIQLGIGGFQPFEASVVDEIKYGDCKGLSNYMKALLNACGIYSEYAVVGAGSNRTPVDIEFPSQQFNHVILCVPNNGDTIWLECTDQKQPFGFLGSFTENRHCLLITEEGGKLVKTPEYVRDTNTQFSSVTIVIDSLGNCKLTSRTNYKALQYENIARYFYQSPKEQKEALYKELNIPNLTIDKFTFEHTNEPIPVATRQLELQINKYATVNGSRMFIPMNPLNARTFIPEKNANRKFPVVLRNSFYDADTISIKIPDNYKIEYFPEPIELDTPYGEYKIQSTANDTAVTICRTLKMNKGIFPNGDYDNVRNYFKSMVNADASKIILIKK